MKWRLDADHYLPGDQHVPAGTEIGDDTAWPFRYAKNDYQDPPRWTAGQAMPPSREMVPLDEEAKALYRKTFGTDAKVTDPLEKIPVLGTLSEAKAPHPAAKRPGITPEPIAPRPANPPSNPAVIPEPKPAPTASAPAPVPQSASKVETKS